MRGQDYDVVRSIVQDVQEYEFKSFMDKDFMANFLWESIRASEHGVHCFFSPSKSPGWFHCPAYLDRATQWTGSNEAALRGTMCHAIMETLINLMLGEDTLTNEGLLSPMTLLDEPKVLSAVGLKSVSAGLTLAARLIEEGASVIPEAFLVAKDTEMPLDGIPEAGKYFGGSVDILAANKTQKTLYVYDLKTGKNIVSADSPQLRCYAVLAVANRIPCVVGRDWNVKVGIIQNGAIDEREYTGEELSDFCDKLMGKIEIYKEYSKCVANGFKDIEERLPQAFGSNKCCRFCSGCTLGG